MKELSRNLRLLEQEDYIWYIYFFIVFFSLLANHFERNSLCTNNPKDQELARKITTTILIIAFFIYLYFSILSFDNLEYVKNTKNNRDIKIARERLVTNIIFLIAGILAILTDYDANSTGVDVGIF